MEQNGQENVFDDFDNVELPFNIELPEVSYRNFSKADISAHQTSAIRAVTKSLGVSYSTAGILLRHEVLYLCM